MTKVRKINISETRKQEIESAITARMDELETGYLAIWHIYSNGIVDKNLLKERVEALSALLADASLSQDNREKLSQELSYATGLYSINTTISSVQNAITQANALAEREQLNQTEILIARNQLQTANTLLSQIWSSDCSKYQDFVSSAKQLQGGIVEIDKKLNLIASAPARRQIENSIAKCRNLIYASSDLYTNRINRINDLLKEFPHFLSTIYEPDLRKQLTTRIEKLPPQVSKLSEKRYKKYQKWAVAQLSAANKEFTQSKESAEAAEKVFRDYILNINPALLLPDVSSLYNSIYQRIYKKLSNKAYMQYKKATYEYVKQLEDF